MKRKLLQLTTLVIAVAFTVMLTACGYKTAGQLTAALNEGDTNETQIVMRVISTDGKATAFDALKDLEEDGKITFEYTESTYGAYITSINGKAEQNIESTMTTSKGYSWMLYTSDHEFGYDYATVTVGERVCYQSSLGASSLQAKPGEIYVWVYEYYDYSW